MPVALSRRKARPRGGGLPALLAALLLLLSACGDGITRASNNNFSASESFRFQFALEERSRLVLDGINGDILVEGSAPDSIIIEGVRRVESESETDARRRLMDLQVEVSDTGDRVHVETAQPNDTRGRNYIVDYEVRLPPDLRVDVDAVNGAVTVESLRNLVEVATVNGVISAEDIEASSVTLSLVNGLIDASIVLPSNGAVALSTVNGNIGLSIPSETSAELDVTVVNGRISLSGLSPTSLTIAPHSVEGQLGDGEGDIVASTVNGNVDLRGF